MEDEFLTIYNKYKDDIFRLAISITKNIVDSEDILQNVFIKYYKKMAKVDKQYTKQWLIKVAINECKSYFISPWKRNTTELKDDNYGINRVEMSFIDELSKLPKKDSLIIHLFYYEGYKINEISAILKMSESNVKVRLHRSKKLLKNLIEEEKNEI